MHVVFPALAFLAEPAVLLNSMGFVVQGGCAGAVRSRVFPDISTAAVLRHSVRGTFIPIFPDLCVHSWRDGAEESAGSAGDGGARAEQSCGSSLGSSWERVQGGCSCTSGDRRRGPCPGKGTVCAGVQAAVPHGHQSDSWASRSPDQVLPMLGGCGGCKEIHQWDAEVIHKNKVLVNCESVFEVDESQTVRQFWQSRLTSSCWEW